MFYKIFNIEINKTAFEGTEIFIAIDSDSVGIGTYKTLTPFFTQFQSYPQ